MKKAVQNYLIETNNLGVYFSKNKLILESLDEKYVTYFKKLVKEHGGTTFLPVAVREDYIKVLENINNKIATYANINSRGFLRFNEEELNSTVVSINEWVANKVEEFNKDKNKTKEQVTEYNNTLNEELTSSLVEIKDARHLLELENSEYMDAQLDFEQTKFNVTMALKSAYEDKAEQGIEL